MKKLNVYKLTTRYGKYTILPIEERYNDNNKLAVCLYDHKTGEPFDDITRNLPHVSLENNEACIDINNCSYAPKFLEDNNIAKPTGRVEYSGFCGYPVYKFNLEKLNKIEEE